MDISPHILIRLARDMLDLLKVPVLLARTDGSIVHLNEPYIETFLGSAGGELPSSLDQIMPSLDPSQLTEGQIELDFHFSEGAHNKLQAVIRNYDELLWIQLISEEGGIDSVQQKRLETLGMLAGGVAHDFNNVLAGILGHITYLNTIMPQEGDHTESLKAIEDGAMKASLLTRQILDFSKVDTDQKPTVVDFTTLTGQILRLLKGSAPLNCETQVTLPDASLEVVGVEGKFAQILVNLVVNARDACGEDGKVTVELLAIEDQVLLKKIYDTNELSSRSYCELRVTDNGCGMSDDLLGRVFEPYFSTKGKDGTGLGLSVVKTIVEEFGGAIDIESEVGIGTAVCVFFPLTGCEGQSSDTDARRKDEELLRGTERILIVDDEYSVRNVIAMSLTHLGYTVDVVASGPEAIEAVKDAELPYDLVLLDMLMPEMSGDEVFGHLKELHQDIRVLVISGFSSKEAVQSILDNGGEGFIQKPFSIDALAKKVRESLSG